jgi:hypothetical protein
METEFLGNMSLCIQENCDFRLNAAMRMSGTGSPGFAPLAVREESFAYANDVIRTFME